DGDGYGRILARTLKGKQELKEALIKSGLPIRIAPSDDGNILCFHVAQQDESLSSSNERTSKLIEEFSPRRNGRFFVSMTRLGWASFGRYLDTFTHSWNGRRDGTELVLARLWVMNPFFNSV